VSPVFTPDLRDPYLDALVSGLSADPQVIGLVLAGSSAQTDRRDQWSDHDFLVITVDGVPERYRVDLSWLPDHTDLAFWFRETAHGLKALYRSGLIVEFAVFDRAEFAACALNHYAVAIDRGGIAELAAEVHDRSRQPGTPDASSCLSSFRAFLSLVYIGTGRARRGERLSANVMLRDYATAHLLRTLHATLIPEEAATVDGLDPWRRIEQVLPGPAAALDAALARPVDEVGLALLDAAEDALTGRWPDYPGDEAAVVRGLLSRA
jgi:hypothetical protein